MTQDAAHGCDLALVMECMRENMMQDERGCANGDLSIGKTKVRVGIELLIRQAGQILPGSCADLLLQESGISNFGTI